jgi:hypothetical protein
VARGEAVLISAGIRPEPTFGLAVDRWDDSVATYTGFAPQRFDRMRRATANRKRMLKTSIRSGESAYRFTVSVGIMAQSQANRVPDSAASRVRPQLARHEECFVLGMMQATFELKASSLSASLMLTAVHH